MFPRFHPHESLPTRRWRKGPSPPPTLLTPNAYTGYASPAETPGTRKAYSTTPAASPYVGGSTPAWNPSSRTPMGAGGELPAQTPDPSLLEYSMFRGGGDETPAQTHHSRLPKHSALGGGETPRWTSVELSVDHMMDMDLSDDDPYGKFTSLIN